MPAAAVYVVAAVAGVAAAIAFKEFVYDPHLAPKFEQWAEELKHNHRQAVARRRQRMELRRGVGVPVRLHDDSDDDDTRRHVSPAMSERGHRPASVELQTLAEQEAQSWREDSVHPGLRRRQPGQGSVHDESPSMRLAPSSPPVSSSASLPTGAAQLLAVAASVRSTARSPSIHPSPAISSPAPRAASPATSERSSTLFSVSSRSSTPEVRSPQPPLRALSVHTDTRSPPSRTLSPFSDLAASPRSGTASPLSVGSPIGSPDVDAMSPFSDFLALDAAPAAVGSPFVPVDAPTNVQTEAVLSPTLDSDDEEMFSFASPSAPASMHGGTSVLGDDTDIEELFSDIGSVHGSELSGWASVGSRRQ